MSKDKKNCGFAWLSIISFLVPTFLIGFCYWCFSKISPGVKPVPFDEYAQNALNITLEASNSLASIAVLLLSGAWGIVITNIEKISDRKLYNMLLLIGGSISLIFSYICYRKALNIYFEILFFPKAVDLTARIIQFWPHWQMIFFVLGFVTFVVLFFFTFLIRR